ncbi:hypothetical protein Ancab_015599 [Ancistrocladus abbreviatus]
MPGLSWSTLQLLLLLSIALCYVNKLDAEQGFCAASSFILSSDPKLQPLYWKVTNPNLSPAHLKDNSISGLPANDVERYAYLEDHVTEQIVGSTDNQPLLETPGEIFELRKLLPTSTAYDFNIHIMDFHPREFLNVKCVALISFTGGPLQQHGEVVPSQQFSSYPIFDGYVCIDDKLWYFILFNFDLSPTSDNSQLALHQKPEHFAT